jgi:hypothetical protein
MAGAPFLVAAMYTDGYAGKAERLRRSCERFGLEHELRRVPSVHQSISRAGTPDLAYTKPRFILDVLERRRRPVLYIDADCEIRKEPVLIAELLAAGTDFAIYNWAADRETDAYVPAPVVLGTPDGVQRSGPRFFSFAWRFEYYDPAQLLCSGAVQLYADTRAARGLLASWQSIIEAFPDAADDYSLCYAYNNRGEELAGLRAAWLPKAYARYAWWIDVEPVIDHPQFAADASHFTPIRGPGGRKPFYEERAERVESTPRFPPGCIVDAHAKRLLTIENKRIVREEPIEREFYT